MLGDQRWVCVCMLPKALWGLPVHWEPSQRSQGHQPWAGCGCFQGQRRAFPKHILLTAHQQCQDVLSRSHDVLFYVMLIKAARKNHMCTQSCCSPSLRRGHSAALLLCLPLAQESPTALGLGQLGREEGGSGKEAETP